MHKKIVEKELGIPPDYQYNALHSNNFVQSNWHKNKMFVTELLSKFNKKMDVLDLGTGSGNFEILFNTRVNKITGVDYNDEALNFLRTYIKDHAIRNVDLVLSDISKLKFTEKNKKFDLIVMIDVIEHLHFDEVEKLFKTFKNYLNIKGRVIIITPNYKSLWPILEYVFDFLNLAPKFREHQHLSKLYKSNLEKLIESNGFKLNNICTFNLLSYLFPLEKISRAICFVETIFPFPIGNLIAVSFSNNLKEKING
jgi:ubiquinone/menaquinone biosynthesis C-methylase UbiE